MIFLQNKALLPSHACPLHVALMKVVGRASRDASWCLHDLFKHVLRLSTPLISKIKNKLRAINELKHKFREVFKALKTNVSRKYFPTTFMLVAPVLFAFIS
jgi:uncharacterized membrane protein